MTCWSPARLNEDMTSLGLRIRHFGSDEDLAANSFVPGRVTVSRVPSVAQRAIGYLWVSMSTASTFALIDASAPLQGFLVDRLDSSAVQRRWIDTFRSLTEGML